MNSGKYNRPITWLQRSTSKDSLGQDKETFASNGTLWGSIEEMSATRQLAFGMLNSQATMVIKLRQYPAVSPNDRLREKRHNQLLIIDGISHGENETVIYCHKIAEVS